MRTYTNPDCVQFVQDMEEAGFEWQHYDGRFHWHGPAVSTSQNDIGLQEVYRSTEVQLQRDDLGRGYILYPVASDKGEEV